MGGIELEFVEWLRAGASRGGPGLPIGVGDDMAMLDRPDGPILISSDMLLDGVHFDTAVHDPARIGAKAAGCCLSDCAAMAVRPIALVVSVALPAAWTIDQAKALASGIEEVARAHGAAVVGGDTTSWAHRLVIDVCVVAEPFPGIEPVRRGGARPGDRLFVTGPLGGSIRGRHMDVRPRIAEAGRIADALGDRLHAMIDVTDGLALDLHRICTASGVGVELDEPMLARAISADAVAAARDDGRTALSHALEDGEDFELLLAASGEIDVALSLIEIGRITDDGFLIRAPDGTTSPLPPRGYVH